MEGLTKMQKFRKNRKEDKVKYEAYLAKERERSKKRRLGQKEVMTDEGQYQERKNTRERVRKYRQKKKDEKKKSVESVPSDIGSFISNRSLQKSVSIIKRKLPISPSKKMAVVRKLALDVAGPTLDLHCYEKKKSPRIREADREKARKFYLNDDISYQMPGRKDTKSVKGVQMQLKFMLMTVGECYQLFKTQNPEIKFGKSIFYQSRPENVRPISETPPNLCVCIYHANFEFMLKSLSEMVPSVPKVAKDFLNTICCDIKDEVCMTSNCKKCYSICDILPLKLNLNQNARWKQWIPNDKRTEVKYEEGTLQLLLEKLENKLKKFKQHFYVHHTQSRFFRDIKENIKRHEAVLQMDFAENFTFVSQDEVQNAHWNQAQATIFTACAWLQTETGLKSHSFAIISNELTHNKESVWYFLKLITDYLKTEKELTTIHVFSDGCAAQFKNRFNIFNLCFAKQDFDVDLTWSFFASGHGKGAVDGIGATVKRSLWCAIMSRQAIINTPKEAFNFFHNTKKLEGIIVLYCDKDDIKCKTELLKKRWENIKPIKNIQQQHFFKKADTNSVQSGLTGASTLKMSSLKRLHYNDVYFSSESE